MNTILITGTAKTIPVKISHISNGFKVVYDVIIWASLEGEQLQFITSTQQTLCGYGDLWQLAKTKVCSYFDTSILQDGAYTQYLDHLTIL
jgi:hypothetical protein